MYKYVVIFLLFLPLLSFSKNKLTFQKVDSLTYQYYLKGDWNKLIGLSRSAFREGIDSKFMRQRTGYAYFMTGDYYAARHQYAKALEFDQGDDFSREYLYYSALNAGMDNSRLYAGNLSFNSASKLGIRSFNPVESVDAEYNLKTNNTPTRFNQTYYRFGINTELSYRVSLYQAYSYYQQYISNVLTQQPEYLAILRWNLTPVWQFNGAYHHLFTNIGNVNYPGDLGYVAIITQLNRFKLEANASILQAASSTTQQAGFQAGVVLPGKSNLYLTSAVTEMFENSSSRTIFSQSAGLKCTNRLWAEGTVTLGNLKNYNTIRSLYVYNSQDPSVFRSGLSLFYFLGKHLMLIGNFTFNQQEIENSSSNNKYYYQYSYAGGIKWKL